MLRQATRYCRARLKHQAKHGAVTGTACRPRQAHFTNDAHPGAIDKQKKHPHSTNHLGAIAPSGEAASPRRTGRLCVTDNRMLTTIELSTSVCPVAAHSCGYLSVGDRFRHRDLR